MKRWLVGTLVAYAGIAALSAVLVPVRSHLSIATPALVLAIPVVAGVAVGGLASGVLAVVAGFIAYDLLFIPPYGVLREVWGAAYGSEAHYLRVYAHRLRRKLGDAGDMLRTQPGIGYQLVED